ncbi:MAG: hypothetical protein NUV57_01690 [archaeon]|nr:hypothetical protein [archaeon]
MAFFKHRIKSIIRRGVARWNYKKIYSKEITEMLKEPSLNAFNTAYQNIQILGLNKQKFLHEAESHVREVQLNVSKEIRERNTLAVQIEDNLGDPLAQSTVHQTMEPMTSELEKKHETLGKILKVISNNLHAFSR